MRDFHWTSADEPKIRAVIKLVRRQLERMDPRTLRCASSVLLALQRLPLATQGVVASLSFTVRDLEADFREWVDIKFSDDEFRFGQHESSAKVGGDTTSDTLFEIQAGVGRRGSIDRWLEIATSIMEEGSVSGNDYSDLSDFDWSEAGVWPEWDR